MVLMFVNYNPPTKGTSLFTKKHDDNLNPSSNSLSIADLYLFKFSNKITMISQIYILSRYISIKALKTKLRNKIISNLTFYGE